MINNYTGVNKIHLLQFLMRLVLFGTIFRIFFFPLDSEEFLNILSKKNVLFLVLKPLFWKIE